MAYQPSLNDLGMDTQSQGGYQPSLGDISPSPDQSSSSWWNPSKWRDSYYNFMQPKTNDQSGHPMVDTFLGRMPDPRYSENSQKVMQPPTQEDMQKTAGIMTMMMAPEASWLKMALPSKLYGQLPELSGVAKSAADYLSTIGKVGTSAAVGNAMMPGSTKTQDAVAGGVGAGAAAVTTPMTMMLGSMNPYARLAAGLATGTGLTYGLSNMLGIQSPYLTGAGGVAGALAGLRGGGAGQMAARNVESAMTPEQAQMATTRQTAGNQVGVPLSLAEASGSPVLGAMQGQAATNTAGSKVLYPWGLARQKAEEDSYNNLLNLISPKNAQQNIIDPLYTKAGSDKVSNADLSSLLREPTIRGAFDSVQANPYYARELQNVPINSIQYLDQVKKNLDDIVNTSYTRGEKYLSQLQNKDVTQMTGVMDAASSTYQAARQAAAQNFNRAYIENAMAKSNITGSNFYNNVLANPKEYNDLYSRLKDPINPNVPSDAQNRLAAMRVAFPDLIDNLTAKSGATLAEKNPDLNFSVSGLAKSLLNKVYMDRYNKAVAELLINPQWSQELQQIAKLTGEDRGIKLGRLISKVATTGSVGAYQNQQGSNQYGTGQ